MESHNSREQLVDVEEGLVGSDKNGNLPIIILQNKKKNSSRCLKYLSFCVFIVLLVVIALHIRQSFNEYSSSQKETKKLDKLVESSSMRVKEVIVQRETTPLPVEATVKDEKLEIDERKRGPSDAWLWLTEEKNRADDKTEKPSLKMEISKDIEGFDKFFNPELTSHSTQNSIILSTAKYNEVTNELDGDEAESTTEIEKNLFSIEPCSYLSSFKMINLCWPWVSQGEKESESSREESKVEENIDNLDTKVSKFNENLSESYEYEKSYDEYAYDYSNEEYQENSDNDNDSEIFPVQNSTETPSKSLPSYLDSINNKKPLNPLELYDSEFYDEYEYDYSNEEYQKNGDNETDSEIFSVKNSTETPSEFLAWYLDSINNKKPLYPLDLYDDESVYADTMQESLQQISTAVNEEVTNEPNETEFLSNNSKETDKNNKDDIIEEVRNAVLTTNRDEEKKDKELVFISTENDLPQELIIESKVASTTSMDGVIKEISSPEEATTETSPTEITEGIVQIELTESENEELTSKLYSRYLSYLINLIDDWYLNIQFDYCPSAEDQSYPVFPYTNSDYGELDLATLNFLKNECQRINDELFYTILQRMLIRNKIIEWQKDLMKSKFDDLDGVDNDSLEDPDWSLPSDEVHYFKDRSIDVDPLFERFNALLSDEKFTRSTKVLKRSVDSKELKMLDEEMTSSSIAKPIVISRVNDFYEKMESIASHIDRLHERFLRLHQLDDDYVSKEFPQSAEGL